MTDPAAGQEQPEVDQLDVDQLDVDQPEAGPLSEWDRLLAQITELDSLVRTVAWGVQHETTELRGALENLSPRRGAGAARPGEAGAGAAGVRGLRHRRGLAGPRRLGRLARDDV